MGRDQRATASAFRLVPDALRLTRVYALLAAPYRRLRAHIDRWLFQLRGPEAGQIVLVQRRIFILPSRHGLTYVGALMRQLFKAARARGLHKMIGEVLASNSKMLHFVTRLGFHAQMEADDPTQMRVVKDLHGSAHSA